MRIDKRFLVDCTQVLDIDDQDRGIEMQCGLHCESCGFFRPIAEHRKKRIRNNDFNVHEDGRQFLKIEQEEWNHVEQGNPNWKAYKRPRNALDTIGSKRLLVRHSR